MSVAVNRSSIQSQHEATQQKGENQIKEEPAGGPQGAG